MKLRILMGKDRLVLLECTGSNDETFYRVESLPRVPKSNGSGYHGVEFEKIDDAREYFYKMIGVGK